MSKYKSNMGAIFNTKKHRREGTLQEGASNCVSKGRKFSRGVLILSLWHDVSKVFDEKKVTTHGHTRHKRNELKMKQYFSLYTWGISSGTLPIHDRDLMLQSPAVLWLRSQWRCIFNWSCKRTERLIKFYWLWLNAQKSCMILVYSKNIQLTLHSGFFPNPKYL